MMMLALEPSAGTAESSRLTSASLLPLLSAAQTAGVRCGDRQALRVGEEQEQGVLACIFQLGSWRHFHFCDMRSLGSGLMELGRAHCLQGTQRLSEQSKDPSQGFRLQDVARVSFLFV